MMDRSCPGHVDCTAGVVCELCQAFVGLACLLPEALDFRNPLLNNFDALCQLCTFRTDIVLCVEESLADVTTTFHRCLENCNVSGKSANLMLHAKDPAHHTG